MVNNKHDKRRAKELKKTGRNTSTVENIDDDTLLAHNEVFTRANNRISETVVRQQLAHKDTPRPGVTTESGYPHRFYDNEYVIRPQARSQALGHYESPATQQKSMPQSDLGLMENNLPSFMQTAKNVASLPGNSGAGNAVPDTATPQLSIKSTSERSAVSVGDGKNAEGSNKQPAKGSNAVTSSSLLPELSKGTIQVDYRAGSSANATCPPSNNPPTSQRYPSKSGKKKRFPHPTDSRGQEATASGSGYVSKQPISTNSESFTPTGAVSAGNSQPNSTGLGPAQLSSRQAGKRPSNRSPALTPPSRGLPTDNVPTLSSWAVQQTRTRPAMYSAKKPNGVAGDTDSGKFRARLGSTASDASSTTEMHEYPVTQSGTIYQYDTKKPREDPGAFRGITNQNGRYLATICHKGDARSGNPNIGNFHRCLPERILQAGVSPFKPFGPSEEGEEEYDETSESDDE